MKRYTLAGREKEAQRLTDICNSGKAEFVVTYGRRRVGKTFLIDQYFGKKYDFYMTGIYQATKQEQLSYFSQQLKKYSGLQFPEPQNWIDAFSLLEQYLQKLSRKKCIVVFIDELPWFDVPRSRFLSAFELFWNGWASKRNNLKLIVCGSSTTWMTTKILANRGGLHNRVTQQIYLRPFNLHETEEFFKMKGFPMQRKQIIETYMVVGGIPYYLDMFQKSLSVAQNIDNLFFSSNAPLKNEFGFLFKSLFNDSELYQKVIETLSTKIKGLTKQEIISEAKLLDNGYLSKVLDNLCQCDFVRSYNAFGKKEREVMYQLTDLYSLFYLRFVKNYTGRDEHHWSHILDSTLAWKGYAFEQVCLQHVSQIKKKIGISGIETSVSSWQCKSFTDSDGTQWNGGQIDLVIDRRDDYVNLCEMKYSDGKFVITKDYNDIMLDRRDTFLRVTHTRKTPIITMVTSMGVAHNMYWDNAQSEIESEDLFEKD